MNPIPLPFSASSSAGVFEQSEFLKYLHLTKPQGSIYVESTEADPKKKALPREAYTLIQKMRAGVDQWQVEEKQVLSLAKHLSEGVYISTFNHWRWINFHIKILFLEIKQIIKINAKNFEDQIQSIDKIYLDLLSGFNNVEVYLTANEMNNNQSYNQGVDLITNAQSLFKLVAIPKSCSSTTKDHFGKIAAQIKERLEFLAECLKSKDRLFPILLTPLNVEGGEKIHSYGLLSFETISKMSSCCPQVAQKVADDNEEFCKKLKDLAKFEHDSKEQKAFNEAMEKGKKARLEVVKFWKSVEGVSSSQLFTECLNFVRRISNYEALSFDDCLQCSKRLSSFLDVSQFNFPEFIESEKEMRKMNEQLFELVVNNCVEKEKNREILLNILEQWKQLQKDYGNLRNDAQGLHYLYQGIGAKYIVFWHDKLESIKFFQKMMRNSNEPPIDKMAHHMCSFTSSTSIKNQNDPNSSNLIHSMMSCIGYVQEKFHSYMDVLLVLDIQERKKRLSNFFNDLKAFETYINRLNVQQDLDVMGFLMILKCFRELLGGPRGSHFSEIIFLVFNKQLKLNDDESFTNLFQISLNSPRFYLALADDVEKEIIAPIEKLPLEEKAKKFTEPLIKIFKEHCRLFVTENTSLKASISGVSNDANISRTEMLSIIEKFNNYSTILIEKRSQFLNAYYSSQSAIMDLIDKQEITNKSLEPLDAIFSAYDDSICKTAHNKILAPTFSIRSMAMQLALTTFEKKKKENKVSSSTSYFLPSLSPSSAPGTAPVILTSKNVVKSFDLIERVGNATRQKVGERNLRGQEYLLNIQTHLLPSIAELIDQDVYLQRTFELCRLLLEQSLKFAVNKKDANLLYEKSDDWREQQLGVSHVLSDLVKPLKSDFEPKVVENMIAILNYFSASSPLDDLRERAALALDLSARLLNYSKAKSDSFSLAARLIKTPNPILIPKECRDFVNRLELLVEEKSRKLTMKQSLYDYFVLKINETEPNSVLLQRQKYFSEFLKSVEGAIDRLQRAFRDANEAIPLAYSSEVYYTSTILIEKSLLLLIAFHGIKGENGEHKIFQKIGSRTQNRLLLYMHNLKELSKILKDHFRECYPDIHVIDEEMEKVVLELQDYNSKTHRYLAKDNTELGKAFKGLHENLQWQEGSTQIFENFRTTVVHPTLINVLQITERLLNMLNL